jgi:hypothetical protein
MPTKDKEKRRAQYKVYISKPGVRSRRNQKTKEWAERNKEHLLARERVRRVTKRAQCLIANARTRAKRRGMTFSLDGMETEIQRRIDAGKCEITGTPFDLSPGRKFNSPSIDRIDAKRGYEPDNVRVVCHAMNAAMGDWGEGPVFTMFINWAKTGNAIVPPLAQEFIKAYQETICAR